MKRPSYLFEPISLNLIIFCLKLEKKLGYDNLPKGEMDDKKWLFHQIFLRVYKRYCDET